MSIIMNRKNFVKACGLVAALGIDCILRNRIDKANSSFAFIPRVE